MTDEQPQDQRPEPSDALGADTASEEDLEGLLAEAAALAGEIARDVGEPESTGASKPSGDQDADADGLLTDLDAQLAELESLAREASTEISADATEGAELPVPPSESEREAALPTGTEDEQVWIGEDDGSESTTTVVPEDGDGEPEEPGSPPPPPPVPSFMEEFTRPEEPEETNAEEMPLEAEPARVAQPRATSAPLGVINADTIHNLPDLDDLAASPDIDDMPDLDEPAEPSAPRSQPKAVSRVEAMPKPEAEGEREPGTSRLGKVAAILSPVALVACERAASILEAIDKPFGKVGELPRQVAGWFAIATLGVALIVLLISLL